MRIFGGRKEQRNAALADSVVIGLLGWPLPTTEAEALREAIVTLHGLRAYAERTLREVPDVYASPAQELRMRLEIVESHCASTLERLARFDQEESP